MRTTVDIPEPLLRRAKAEAALRGTSLKELVNEALRTVLNERSGQVSERAPAYGTAHRQVLSEECVFPLIRGADGPDLQELTPERVHEILEREEVDRELEATDPR